MPVPDDTRARSVVNEAERILTEAMLAHQRRCASDLSLCLDDRAFGEAVGAFDRVREEQRHRAYRDEEGRNQMMRDTDLQALDAFLWCYLTRAGRS